jgi:C-terminal processing protease CtpA/Prc
VNFLNANTDGLVLDITRNTGGGCYAENAMDFLIPYPYQILGDQIRATRSVLTALEAQVASLPPGLPDELVEQFEALVESVRTAYNKNRGLTDVLPGCTLTLDRDTARNRFGDTIAYRKPMIILVDELSISYADYSAAILQEAGRGPLFGYRTNGAGGSVYSTDAGFYSESSTSVTWTIGARNRYIGTDDYGTTNRLENVGVRPEISFDYMTRDNLISGGKLFTDAFTAAILQEIGRNQ